MSHTALKLLTKFTLGPKYSKFKKSRFFLFQFFFLPVYVKTLHIGNNVMLFHDK